MTPIRVLLILIFGSILLTTSASALEGQMAKEFNFLSGQTQQSMALSAETLQGFVTRCDLLLEKTSSLPKSEKKVLEKKLKRLRGLFLFVIESRKASSAEVPVQ